MFAWLSCGYTFLVGKGLSCDEIASMWHKVTCCCVFVSKQASKHYIDVVWTERLYDLLADKMVHSIQATTCRFFIITLKGKERRDLLLTISCEWNVDIERLWRSIPACPCLILTGSCYNDEFRAPSLFRTWKLQIECDHGIKDNKTG